MTNILVLLLSISYCIVKMSASVDEVFGVKWFICLIPRAKQPCGRISKK